MNDTSLRAYIAPGSLALAVVMLPYSFVFCHLALGVFLVNWIWEGHWKNKAISVLRQPAAFIFIFFFLLHVVGALYSEDHANGWYNVEKKIALVLMPVALATSAPMGRRATRWVLTAFTISCAVAIVFCFCYAFYRISNSFGAVTLESVSPSEFYGENYATGNRLLLLSYAQLTSPLHLHPTYLSLYLAFCALIMIDFYGKDFHRYTPGKKIILLVFFGGLCASVVCLSSRIVLLAFAGIICYGVVTIVPANTARIAKAVYALLGAGVLAALVYLFPVSRYRAFQEISALSLTFRDPGLQTQSAEIHASLWWLGLQSIGNVNPLWGAGTGDVQHVMNKEAEKKNIRNVMGTYDPHSQYLQTFIGLGVVGLGTLLLCFCIPAIGTWQTGNALHVGFMVLFSFVCLTESVLEQQKGIVFFAVFNSLLIFQYPRKANS